MKRALLVSFSISVLLGIFALYAGMQHNTMGEFCRDDNLDVCKIDYLYASFIFLSWVVVSFLAQIIAIYLVRIFIRLSHYLT